MGMLACFLPLQSAISECDYFLIDRLKWAAKYINWNFDPFMFLAKKNTKIIIGGNSSVQKRLNIKDDKFICMTQVASNKLDNSFQENKRAGFHAHPNPCV
jgi:hypothetical protein